MRADQGVMKMHMADALISPTVGGTMWAVSAGAVAWSCRKVRADLSDKRVPLMGVTAAFAFAAQMINFAIPGTGSSGHLGGGLLLAVILGPEAALLTMVSVLTVQAVFFADGGLLALGCNIFNLGVIPCLIAYPLVFQRLRPFEGTRKRLAFAAFAAAIFALQLGAFAVVMQTFASGISELPFGVFVLLMQPIHLAIGLVEGAATLAVIGFIHKARPELLASAAAPVRRFSVKRVAVVFGAAALLLAGGFSRLAAEDPDGLEWAVAHTAEGDIEKQFETEFAHQNAAALQAETALLPEYDFAPSPDDGLSKTTAKTGTTVAGIAGGFITLLVAAVIAWLLGRKKTAENP
jgi:cobalt/nickel transport system permease protein